jgi:hypothetical protein
VRRLGLAVLLEHRVGERELRRVDVGHRDDVRVGAVGVGEQDATFAADADVADADGPSGDGTPRQRRGAEGNYLLVNKNLIEAAAVAVVLVFRTGRIAGLDLLRGRARTQPVPSVAEAIR